MGLKAKQQLESSHIEDLPSYIYGGCCESRHFLAINKDVYGNWSCAYVSFEDGCVLHPMNNSKNLKEAATRLYFALQRPIPSWLAD